MSSTILYLAIVAIWAGVLVPRWLRREPHREASAPSRDTAVVDGGTAVMAVGAPGADEARPQRETETGWQPRRSGRARAMAARRRLFGILVALAFAATTIAIAGLATWWVVVPPAGMLAGYVLLLREAARADAEIWAAHDPAATAGRSAHRQVSARPVTRSAAPADDQIGRQVAGRVADTGAGSVAGTLGGAEETGTADVVDIMSRVDEELYDQYADAKLRAVGD